MGVQIPDAKGQFGIAKSSTSFGWGKGWNVTSAEWQVTLYDPIWHVNSSSVVATAVLLYSQLSRQYIVLIVRFTFCSFSWWRCSV